MYIDFKKIFSVLFLIILGVVLGVTSIKIINRYQAPKQTVTVIGTGEIDAATDQATISVQIKSTSTTYEKAQVENKKDVENLKSELVKLGIPESRITTSGYSSPNIRNMLSGDTIETQEFKMMPRPPVDNSPTVTTNLTLIIDPIKNIEKIYDVVSNNTNALITNSYYSLKNRKIWESKAKDEALKDIRNQIESVAKINRLRVGKLLTLEDSNSPKPYPVAMKALNDQAVSSSENIYYSEQTVKITSSYTATYELY